MANCRRLPLSAKVKFFLAFHYFVATEVGVMVYTERPKGPHVISLRKAEKHEARYYRQVAKENLG